MSSQSPEPETQGPSAGSPSEFLKNIVGKRVKVRIGSGVDYHGECPIRLAVRICITGSGAVGWMTGGAYTEASRLFAT